MRSVFISVLLWVLFACIEVLVIIFFCFQLVDSTKSKNHINIVVRIINIAVDFVLSCLNRNSHGLQV